MLKKIFSLNSWIRYIKTIHNIPIDLSLDRVKFVAKKLGLLHPSSFVITVGGTNGKGTTCALLENILLSYGLKVGVYSSPHLFKYTERIRIQGNELPENIHIQAISKVNFFRKLISLSYFEFITLTALLIFKQSLLDVIILEVGLGGKLDATNIIDADISIITSIAIDHIKFLGSNRDLIAIEKFGIFRKKKPAIIGEINIPKSALKYIKEIGSKFYFYNKDWWWKIQNNYKWKWCNKTHTIKDLKLPNIPIQNAATALTALNASPFLISKYNIQKGLSKTKLFGRFQIINTSPITILDVAHNPHASQYLSRYLVKKIKKIKKLRVMIGVMKDKDIYGIINSFNISVHEWYCVSLNTSRAANAEQISMHINHDKIKKFNKLILAWNKINSDSSFDDCILIFGSFRIVKEIINLTKFKKTSYFYKY
ncbi:MAG: bifunctional tetrahydrofolate synthase/dihydrofolate synthase [Enterobacterales bacterium]